MRISDWSSDVCSFDLKKVQPLPLFAAAGIEDRGAEPAVSLPQMDLSEHVVEDYRALRVSLKAHPLSFLRQSPAREGLVEALQLELLQPCIRVRVAGLVLVRKRPGASVVSFSTGEAGRWVGKRGVRPFRTR